MVIGMIRLCWVNSGASSGSFGGVGFILVLHGGRYVHSGAPWWSLG